MRYDDILVLFRGPRVTSLRGQHTTLPADAEPAEVSGLEAGDVVILLGVPESLALAETRLLQG